MKKLIYLIASVCILSSCDSYLDVNKDPNYPGEVPNALLIPSAENFISAKLGEQIYNFGGFFAQYWDQAVEANQYNDIAEYNILQAFFNGSYRDLYAGALADLKVVKEQAVEEEAWGDYLVASVLNAYTYQILVDMMDQTPYSEALLGSANTMPKWDDGKDVYAAVIAEIDDALAKVTDASTISEDLLLDANIEEWIAFANAMKLKLYMRASDVQDNGTKIMALINSESVYFSDDIKMDVYADEAEKRNPWFECNWSGTGLGTDNNIASYPIITYLKYTDDPRLPKLFDKAINKNDYVGLIPGSKTKMPAGTKTKDFSFPKMTATTPVHFYSKAELYFFIAEAQLRFGSASAAKTAYEAAIAASFAHHGLSGAATFAAKPLVDWDAAASTAAKIELIGMQKWVALCMVNHYEAWTELRRLDVPKLSTQTASAIYADGTKYTPGQLIAPWANSLGGSTIVKRLPFPETAVNLNKNTPTGKKVTDLVWWDKK